MGGLCFNPEYFKINKQIAYAHRTCAELMSQLSEAAEISLSDAAELASADLIACSTWMLGASFSLPINIGH